ncbi:MAG TPA: TasA family protein [Candidatus Paceibacterota bacterium]|nr:TasA family protein [Candidatus Paceibacterota bacterium]
MKKIILSLAIVGVVGAIVIGGTIAYFSDTETSTGNTFTAGTLDLDLTDSSEDGTEGETGTFRFSNMAPGHFEGEPLTLRNVGSVDGYINLLNIIATNTEGYNPESETGDKGEPGELGDNLQVMIFFDKNANGIYNGSGDVLVSNWVALNSLATAYNTNYFLASGASVILRVHWELPTSTGNDVQGDIADLSFTVELNQVPH